MGYSSTVSLVDAWVMIPKLSVNVSCGYSLVLTRRTSLALGMTYSIDPNWRTMCRPFVANPGSHPGFVDVFRNCPSVDSTVRGIYWGFVHFLVPASNSKQFQAIYLSIYLSISICINYLYIYIDDPYIWWFITIFPAKWPIEGIIHFQTHANIILLVVYHIAHP